MQRTSQRVQLRSGGRIWQLVREQYLRPNISCQSPLCFEGCETAEAGPALPRDSACYLVPADDVLRLYMDVLELPEITGIVFTQTALARVFSSSGKRRLYRRVRKLIHSTQKQSVFFANEFCTASASGQRSDESFSDWQRRLQYEAAVYYHHHLGGQVAVLMLCEDAAFAQEYGHRQPGVFVQNMDQFLTGFWPDLTAARDIYDGVKASLADGGHPSGSVAGENAEHLPLSVLEAGVSSGQFVRGNLVVNKHQAQREAFVTRASAGADKESTRSDLLIVGAADRNRAVHGDVVVVSPRPRAQWRHRSVRLAEEEEPDAEGEGEPQPTARVVGVLRRGWGEYVVSLQVEEDALSDSLHRSGWHLVVPFDRRIPKIRIKTSQADTLRTQRFIVRIDSWPLGSAYPQGHFVRSLGPVGDLETEVQVILAQNDVSPRPFSEAVLAEMPSADWRPGPGEVALRRDLRRSRLVFSVDPPGCEDVDDAMSVQRLPDGALEVGVHIADVARFVARGSAADLEARRRGTTVYLADRRLDMLPAVLSANLCSLLGGVDRCAVSVIWRLDPETLQVRHTWFGRSLIRSRYKMFYEAAQRLVDGDPAEALAGDVPEWTDLSGQELQHRYAELRAALRALTRLAHHLRSQRQQDGALELESTEVQFEFDEGGAKEMKPKQALEIHETVAEMMIFANRSVAEKIAQAFPLQALLRRHGAARPDQWEPLRRCAAARGWTVRTGSNRQVADSLARCVDPRDPQVNLLLRLLATRAMVNAEYFSTGAVGEEDWGHYGLALSRYTHFTSPIRRYADVVVHRLLLAAISADGSTSQSTGGVTKQFAATELQEVADHLNERNRAAQCCQRDSQVLFQTVYFARRPADDPANLVDAVVFSLRQNGFLAYVPAYALRGPVYLQTKDGQVAWVCDEKVSWESESRVQWMDGDVTQGDTDVTVRTELGEQVYRLLDHVTVHIRVLESTAHAHQLRLDLITNAAFSASFREAALAARTDRTSARQLVQEVSARQPARPHESGDEDCLEPEWPRRPTSLYSILQKHCARSLRV